MKILHVLEDLVVIVLCVGTLLAVVPTLSFIFEHHFKLAPIVYALVVIMAFLDGILLLIAAIASFVWNSDGRSISLICWVSGIGFTTIIYIIAHNYVTRIEFQELLIRPFMVN